MKYVDEFRNKDIVAQIAGEIRKISQKPVSLMEVCGGHTMAIQKFGIPFLLPDNIKLLSGPGCPVCVTDVAFLDKAVALSRKEDVIITTYGDLIRVPGSSSTLEKEKARGADIRMVYSTMEALAIAKGNPDKKVVFLGIGFETTSPATAVSILDAEKNGISNFYLLSAHKVMPPAMAAIVDEGVKLNGFIAPGHVSTITGKDIYSFIPEKYGLAVAISGFEPVDLLQSIYMLVKQIETNEPKVEIQYSRVVKPEGNTKARQMLEQVFEPADANWRGLGIIKNSGYRLRDKYSVFDAEKNIRVEVEKSKEPAGCICGEVLKGLKQPTDCKLFAKACTPENPVGACMVSGEGACQAYYKYRNYEENHHD